VVGIDRKGVGHGVDAGIDLACQAAHVASLAGPDGTLVWSGRTFFTQAKDLEQYGGTWTATRPS
jgi:hypothetical protein